MNVRRMPSAPPNSPASNTTLSRGDAWPDWDASVVVESARLMREEHIGSLPITDDEQLVGMITDRDITTRVVAEAANPQMTSVGDVYSRNVISVEPDKDLEEALELMARHQVRRLPVVEK